MSSKKSTSPKLIDQSTGKELSLVSDTTSLLDIIRPEWKSKDLISRTRKLLDVDPSSACQRLLNATIYDLRDKIIHAGIDIAKDAADRFKLPSITKPEDITENYTTARIIEHIAWEFFDDQNGGKLVDVTKFEEILNMKMQNMKQK